MLDIAVDDSYIRSNPSNNVLKELKQSHVFKTEKRKALTKPQQDLLLDFLQRNHTYQVTMMDFVKEVFLKEKEYQEAVGVECNDEVLMKGEDNPVLLPHFSCHTLRHTFTTRMCEAGVNVKVIPDTLGHADIATILNIYADVAKELKSAEFVGLDGFFQKTTEKDISEKAV